MKKIIYLITLLLIALVISSCGSTKLNKASDESDTYHKKETTTDTTSSAYDVANDTNTSDEVLKELLDNQTDPEKYNNLLYGDFDFSKAINLYYECLNEIYEYDIVSKVDKIMMDRYNTSDYRTAFEIYGKDDHHQTITSEQFFANSTKRTPDYEEAKKYIENYNKNIPSSSYACIESYEEMGGKYGEYMAEATNSMKIPMEDIDEMVMYIYQENDNEVNVLCVKIDDKWYPVMFPQIVSYEQFSSYLSNELQ